MPTIHIVSHTHWDREWYKSFQYFRTKLIYVIDDLLSILENDDNFKSFLLDGQTIVLDDYLQLRPEKAPQLKELITNGRLVVGPWYIQPDEFAPDGESLIRNLQTGIREARRFGQSMMVGYLPDSFGQSGQLPHILQGFDIQSAVIMRGFPANEVKSSEFHWQGINGDEVMGIAIPEGYSNYMYWPQSLTMAKMRMVDTVRKLKKYASTDQFLIMNGVDHQFAQAHVSEHIRKMNRGRTKYRHSTIQGYIDAVKAQNPDLPTLHGELLAPITNRVHSSMASTRMPQKQQNRKMEALLEKYVEPVCTLGWLFNANYPDVLVNQAWKLLMQNQTHDGICGCCTDQVHKEIDQRYADVKEIGETLLKTYSRAIARQQNGKSIALTVFNSTLSKGKQVVQATLFSKHQDFRLLNPQGKEIPYQVDAVEPLDLAEASMWVLYLGIPEPGYRIDFTFEYEFDFNIG
jgi:mannosylglycerate hydrolase